MDSQKRERNPAITAAIVTGVFGIVAAIIGGCFLITNTLIENGVRNGENTPTMAPSLSSPATGTPIPASNPVQTPITSAPPRISSPTIEKDNVFVTAIKTVAVFTLLVLAIMVTFFTVFIDIFLLLFGLNFSLTTGLWAFVWQTVTISWYWNRAEGIGLILGIGLVIFIFFMNSRQNR